MRDTCGTHRHHGGHDDRGCCCQCHCGMGFTRRFSTREERIARLEEYLKELQAEARAVEERIAEMR